MHTDPIADMLTRLRNAACARMNHIELPYSKLKEQIAQLMKKHGYVADVDSVEKDERKVLRIRLVPGRTLELKRVSSPGQRVYRPHEDIRFSKGGYGISILTTSQGLMTDKEAKKKKIGGEVICEVF